MRIREIVIDVGWMLLLVLILPVALPLVALGFIGLLGKRLYDRQRQPRTAATSA